MAVAAHLGLRPHETLRLLSHPLVQQYLDLARAADNDRGLTIARRTLESAINATDCPVEKRRAATTLSTLCRFDCAPRRECHPPRRPAAAARTSSRTAARSVSHAPDSPPTAHGSPPSPLSSCHHSAVHTPPLQPASTLPSPAPLVADFVAALRRDPDDALPFVASYVVRTLGKDGMRRWLGTARHMLARAGAPGHVQIDDLTDSALVHIAAPTADDSHAPAHVIKAVLERNRRGEHRWRVAEVRPADTS